MAQPMDISSFENLLKGRPESGLLRMIREVDEDELPSVRLSIFDLRCGTIEQDMATVERIISGNNKGINPQELKLYQGSIGAMVGMALADSMGHRFEFKPFCYEGDPQNLLTDMGTGPGGQFHLQPGQWTDDTSMGLCLADSLLMNKEWDPHDLMNRFLAWWSLGYNNAFRYDQKSRHSCGLGGNISLALEEYIVDPSNPYTVAGDSKTSGNGSVMRNAPIPICFYNDMGSRHSH